MLNIKTKVLVNNSSQPSGVTLPPKKMENMSVEEFYNTFKFYQYNRGKGTDMKRAEKMAFDIAYNGTWWMVQPVVIDKKRKIILDGNHTGTALIIAHNKHGVDLQVPIIFTDVPKEISVGKSVQKLNNSREGWTLEEYILNYIQEGNDNYKRLSELGDKLGYPFVDAKGKKKWNYIADLSGVSKRSALKEGLYTITEQHVEEQLALGKEIISVWKAAGEPVISSWFEGFVIGYIQIRKFFEGDNTVYEDIKRAVQKEENKIHFDGKTGQTDWVIKFKKMLRNS